MLTCMTTTHQLNVSVLTAPIAQIDRRTLSQAWYSALHLARVQTPQPKASRPKPSTSMMQRVSSMQTEHEQAHRLPAAARLLPLGQVKRYSGFVTPERRAQRLPATRAIERALLHPLRKQHGAMLQLHDGSRCHISLLQRDGVVHLVAVVSPKHVALVRQALDQARFALARSGVVLMIVWIWSATVGAGFTEAENPSGGFRFAVAAASTAS